METIPVKPITSWSYSRYSTYKQCPRKLKYQAIDKIKEPKNEHLERGIRIHDGCENYIKSKSDELPEEANWIKEEIDAHREQYKKIISGMVVEDNWSFKKDWSETHWRDWAGCWLRVKLDLAHHEDEKTLVITDWKTGKYRPDNQDDYKEQLQLYALAALLIHEHIEVVKPRLVYLDAQTIYPTPETTEEEILTFRKSDIPDLKKVWEIRTKPMFNDTLFATNPSYLCRWCHYRKSNKENGGGQCEF